MCFVCYVVEFINLADTSGATADSATNIIAGVSAILSAVSACAVWWGNKINQKGWSEQRSEILKDRFVSGFYKKLDYQRVWRSDLLKGNKDFFKQFLLCLECSKENGELKIDLSCDTEYSSDDWVYWSYRDFSLRSFYAVDKAPYLSAKEKKSYTDLIWSMCSPEERALLLLEAWRHRRCSDRAKYRFIVERADDPVYRSLLNIAPDQKPVAQDGESSLGEDFDNYTFLSEELETSYLRKRGDQYKLNNSCIQKS